MVEGEAHIPELASDVEGKDIGNGPQSVDWAYLTERRPNDPLVYQDHVNFQDCLTTCAEAHLESVGPDYPSTQMLNPEMEAQSMLSSLNDPLPPNIPRSLYSKKIPQDKISLVKGSQPGEISTKQII